MLETDSLIGQKISHYRILVKLGEGGVGVVYRAVDERLKRDVALKFLSNDVAKDEHVRSRFQREAQSASKFSHPNICTIYEYAEDGDRVFIAMELVNGKTLKEYILGPLLSISETIDIAIQITYALDAAHENGVIHRDIKPANVMVTARGLVKVLDFGLAKEHFGNDTTILTSMDVLDASGADHLSVAGNIIGTVSYMSPEQTAGEEIDIRTDLFSFGIVLYEVSTGVLPFRGCNPIDVLHAIRKNDPTQPTQINPDIPPELERIIKKTLEKEREVRYQRASDIRSDLQRLKRDIDSKRIDSNTDDGEPIVKSRVLEAAAPKQSSVGRATEILTVIRLPDSEGLRKYIHEEQSESLTADDVRKKDFSLTFPSDLRGKPQLAEVVLRIDSPNFEPCSQSKKLKVPPKHDSDICTFLLTPLVAGELLINLELLMGDQIIVSRSIRTRAAFEGASVSSEKVLVIVALPLIMRVDTKDFSELKSLQKESIPTLPVSAKPDQTGSVLLPPETSIPPTSLPISKSKNFKGRIIAVIGALAVVALAILVPLRKQTGVQTATRPPVKQVVAAPPVASNKTGQDASDYGANQDAKELGPKLPTGKKHHDNNDKEREALSEALKQVPNDPSMARMDLDGYEIGLLLKRLSTAISRGSVSELQEIWPQIGGQQKALKSVFRSNQTISRTFDIKTFTFSSNEQRATLTGVYHDTIIADGKTLNNTGGFTLLLVKTGGKWLIENAEFKPDSSVIQ